MNQYRKIIVFIILAFVFIIFCIIPEANNVTTDVNEFRFNSQIRRWTAVNDHIVVILGNNSVLILDENGKEKQKISMKTGLLDEIGILPEENLFAIKKNRYFPDFVFDWKFIWPYIASFFGAKSELELRNISTGELIYSYKSRGNYSFVNYSSNRQILVFYRFYQDNRFLEFIDTKKNALVFEDTLPWTAAHIILDADSIYVHSDLYVYKYKLGSDNSVDKVGRYEVNCKLIDITNFEYFKNGKKGLKVLNKECSDSIGPIQFTDDEKFYNRILDFRRANSYSYLYKYYSLSDDIVYLSGSEYFSVYDFENDTMLVYDVKSYFQPEEICLVTPLNGSICVGQKKLNGKLQNSLISFNINNCPVVNKLVKRDSTHLNTKKQWDRALK